MRGANLKQAAEIVANKTVDPLLGKHQPKDHFQLR